MLIQQMRDKSQGLVAKIVVALIIVVFALFGFGSITTFLQPVPKVATVGGEDITQQQMEVAVERNRRIMIANGTPASQIDDDQLRQQVLDQLINRELLSQASERLGLYFSDKALDREIVQTPAFQIDGVFNPQQFQVVIGSAGYTPVTYRQEMRKDMKFQQLSSGIQQSAFYTRQEVEDASALSEQKRDVAYLRIDVDSLMDDVDVSDDEIAQYYNAHQSDFMTPETVNLSYLELKRDDLLDDVNVTDEEIRAHYEQTKAQYATTEKRDIAHILIETNDDVSDEEAKKQIDDIYEKIKDGGDFAALAKKYSEDPGSASKGGDLGYNTKGTFVEKFEDVAFNLKVNEVSKPFKTQFGYHIVKVLGVEPGKTPSFAEVRDKVEQDLRKSRSEELFVTKSSKLAEIAYESPDLTEPAKELGLQIKTTGPVTRDAKEGIAANDQVMQVAFSPDLLVDGNNSDVIEITPNDHVVVHVKDHHPSELKPLADVRDEVKTDLARQKATKLAGERAQEIVSMLEQGDITRYVADKFGLEWQVVAGAGRNQQNLDPAIADEAFSLARPPGDGKSVGYTVLNDGDAAVVTVTNVQDGNVDDMSEDNIRRVARVLGMQHGRHTFGEFREDLARNAEVTRKQ